MSKDFQRTIFKKTSNYDTSRNTQDRTKYCTLLFIQVNEANIIVTLHRKRLSQCSMLKRVTSTGYTLLTGFILESCRYFCFTYKSIGYDELLK